MSNPEVVNVAINGFGRIGTPFARVAIEDPEIELLAINNGRNNSEDAAKRLRFDNTHGWFRPEQISYDTNHLTVDGKDIPVYMFRDPALARWNELETDDLTVIESTGQFNTTEKSMPHIESGAKRVILTAPAKDGETITIVRGVNDTEENLAKAAQAPVVAASSCSTNNAAPLTKVLGDNFELEITNIGLVHAFTASQSSQDSGGTNIAERRTFFDSINPYPSGSQKEIERLLGEDYGKFNINCVRVPVSNGSLAMMSFVLMGRHALKDFVDVIIEASETTHKGIILPVDEGMNSKKVNGMKATCVFDIGGLHVVEAKNTTTLYVPTWYDNEVGYTNTAVAGLAKALHKAS